jgi:hypothetical protein
MRRQNSVTGQVSGRASPPTSPRRGGPLGRVEPELLFLVRYEAGTISVSHIADILGLTHQRTSLIVRRPGFPAPVGRERSEPPLGSARGHGVGEGMAAGGAMALRRPILPTTNRPSARSSRSPWTHVATDSVNSSLNRTP